MNNIRKNLITIATGLALAGIALAGNASAQATASVVTAKDMIGQWVSVKPEFLGQFYGLRSFSFTERAWSIVFRAFADEKASQPLFTLRVEGNYVLGAELAKMPATRPANFFGNSKYITSYTQDFLKIFAGNNPWKLGTEYDFSNTGAGFFPSSIDAPLEYDLVKLDNGLLYLGDRSGDLSKERPQKLNAYPLVRK
jgi:hypothetical protein